MTMLIALLSCAPTLQLTPPADLPEQVLFRSATESFGGVWSVAVRDGRIWVKPSGEGGEWTLLGATGLPEGRLNPPQAIAEISADGHHLHALSSDGAFYRGTSLERRTLRGFGWTDRWGWPMGRGPGITAEFSTERGWAVSDSHPGGVRRYEDILGTEHAVGLGVAHVYRLGPQGERIYFSDWWLPADWSRQICGPRQGRLRMARLSASASTLFVVGTDGSLHTRLYDFDTAGENDLLTYSYVLDGPAGTTRALPAEGWRQHPRPDGEITDRITIFQDGEGNHARILRIEGQQGELAGYFEKRIDEDAWAFYPSGEPLRGALLPLEDATVDVEAVVIAGTISRPDLDVVLQVELSDYDLFCSPATATLSYQGSPLTVGGEPLELEFHHVRSLSAQEVSREFWRDGDAVEIRGALLLSGDIDHVDSAGARAALQRLLGDRAVVNFVGEGHADGLSVEELDRRQRFQVPLDEKAPPGQVIRLEASR